MAPCVLDLSAVHDASAKLPAGLLNGNVNQYGDIDQCLQVRSPWQGPGRVIKGRYCLTTTALRLSDPHHPLLRHIHRLLHSHYMFRSELDDVSAPTGCKTHRTAVHPFSVAHSAPPSSFCAVRTGGMVGAHCGPRWSRPGKSPNDVRSNAASNALLQREGWGPHGFTPAVMLSPCSSTVVSI
jgi:hypothetical protein